MSTMGEYNIKYIENGDSVDLVTDMNGNFSAVSNELDNIDGRINNRALLVHKHSANDLTSILPVSKGGTGASTTENARKNLGLGIAAIKSYTTSVESGSTDLITSGGVYSAIVNSNKIYVYASDTPDEYKDVKDGMLISNIRTAIATLKNNGLNVPAEIILLPGTHTLSIYLSASDTKGFTDLTIRGLSPVLRDECIINYNGSVTCMMRFEDCTYLTFKDFRTKTSTASVEVIEITGKCKSFVCKNLNLQGGHYGIKSSVLYNNLYNIEIGNCIFNKINTGDENIYGTANVIIEALGDNYATTSGEIATAKIYGNVCLNDGIDFNYTCKSVPEKSKIIEYGNFISTI